MVASRVLYMTSQVTTLIFNYVYDLFNYSGGVGNPSCCFRAVPIGIIVDDDLSGLIIGVEVDVPRNSGFKVAKGSRRGGAISRSLYSKDSGPTLELCSAVEEANIIGFNAILEFSDDVAVAGSMPSRPRCVKSPMSDVTLIPIGSETSSLELSTEEKGGTSRVAGGCAPCILNLLGGVFVASSNSTAGGSGKMLKEKLLNGDADSDFRPEWIRLSELALR